MTVIPRNTIILDAEIENAIPKKDQERWEGVQYCAGWKDYAGMGLSVVTTFSYVTGRLHVFLKDNLPALTEQINGCDHVVTFNGTGFDVPLLNEHGVHIPEGKHYDACLEIRRAAGASKFERGYSLAHVLEANMLPAKGQHSADAPMRWQRGQHGLVIESCLMDTNALRLLLEDSMRGDIYAGSPARTVTLPPIPHVTDQ